MSLNNSLSELFIGGNSASALAEAISLNSTSSTVTSTKNSTSDRFWSSEPALVTSATQETLEISFSSASLTNRISFEAVRFPQTITVEYSAANSNTWLPVIDSNTNTQVKVTILESYPIVLPNPSLLNGHTHPQHDFTGHWQHVSIECLPESMQRLRFVIQRNPLGKPPVDSSGNPAPYSVALQNIKTGYEISSRDDIPRSLPHPTIPTATQVFANTTDILGSNLGFSTKTQSASNLSLNTNSSAPYIWKSEPQPFNTAVVNFYADMRDAAGNAQTIDQIFIDPLYNGPSINLYYSNDKVNPPFDSPRTGLTGSQGVLNNAVVNGDGSISFGVVSGAQTSPGSVVVDNKHLSFDPSVDWWTGMQVKPAAQPTDSTQQILFDANEFKVGINKLGLFLSTIHGDTNQVPFTLTTDPIQLIAGSVNGMLHLTVQQNSNVASNQIPISVALGATLPSKISIGADLPVASPSLSTLSAFVLKQETLLEEAFLNHTAEQAAVGLFKTAIQAEINALLRFDGTLTSPTSPTGFVGGPAFGYGNMNWTPIPRKYEMQRGNLKVPTTNAKFWKLEVTNLAPEINEKYVPITTTVKTFPPSVSDSINRALARVSARLARYSTSDVATLVQSTLNNALGFTDKPTYVGTNAGAQTGITPTQVYVANDPSIQDKLNSLGNPWKYQALHASRTAPIFAAAGKHVYKVQKVTQTKNVSYFAGLRQITFFRSQLTVPQEFPAIEIDFIDPIYIGNGNWQITPGSGGLYSGSSQGASYAQTTSVHFPTQRAMRAVQFAAQQTDAKEISISGEFDEANYAPQEVQTWTTVGDGKLLGLVGQDENNSSLLVSRQTNLGFWADQAVNSGAGTWGAIETANPTYKAMGQGTYKGNYVGGIQSASVGAPLGGRVHAAARVTTAEDLTSPLYIQILDADTGSVISENQSNVSKNELNEWYTSVDVSTFGAKIGATWGSLVKKAIWPTFSDGFLRANASSLNLFDTGQLWTTPNGYTSLTIASQKALASVTSSRSEVDLGTPWGTLTVKLGNLITTPYTPLVDLGGLLLMNDNTVRSTNVSPPSFTMANALTAGHTYTFQFIPTSQVPSGQLPSGVNPVVSPYSVIVSDNGTWIQTHCTVRSFSSVRALMGATGQTFSQFSWTPGVAQVNMTNQQLTLPVPPASSLQYDGGTTYEWNPTKSKKWIFNGKYTYSAVGTATQAASISPDGTAMLAAPSSLTVTPQNDTTGVFTAGTYFWKVTAVASNEAETTGSNEVTSAIASLGNANLSWTAVSGAKYYKIYRSTTAGSEFFVGTSSTNAYQDTGNAVGTTSVPKVNGTQGGGTMAVTDVLDQYGAMSFNVTQMPLGLPASAVVLAYLNYNQVSGKILQLMGDGSIYNPVAQTTVKSSMFANPLAGQISIRYVSAQTLSSAFRSTWSIASNANQAIIVLQSGVVAGVYSGTNIWDTTWRGIGGANNGSAGNAYTIIEGFGWYPDGSLLVPNTSAGSWAQVSYSDTRTYGQMNNTVLGSTRNLQVRLLQKTPSLDRWFVQSCTLFWDPVIWEFSCDGGNTWWEAFDDIRNNPSGVMLFPVGLGGYSDLMWRITSYSGDVTVSHLVIRPWYTGMHGPLSPRPSQLPQGPNSVPTDTYDAIENDPRWAAWDKPVPRWWWNGGKSQLPPILSNS